MATSDELKEAADAVALAKANEAVAQALVNSKYAEAIALIPDEQSALEAAQAAHFSALNAAFTTVGYDAAASALSEASVTREIAVEALVAAAANYNGA